MTPPLIEGGQGRTAEEIEDDALGGMAVVVYALVVLLGLIAGALWGIL